MQKDDPSHTCKDEDVETRKLLLNNTKPCPKCGAMICKVDGCDQMWCVLCHTTFSWRTGETVTSERVHNPHYYEWLRRTSSTMPREPGDIPICHQLPQARTLSAFVHGTPQFSSIMALHRILSHIQYAELPSLETRQRTFETERECYLEGKLDETAFKNALGLHEQKSDRCKALHDIFDLFYRQGIEEINAIVRGENPKTHLQVMEELRNYCNVQFAKTCRTFNIRKYEIADGFVAVRRVK